MNPMDGLEKVKYYITDNLVDPFECEDLKNFLLSGSKMIRSKLAILYLKSFNREPTEDIYKILAAGEIIHNASLLHDDILDEAKTRRGIPTLGELYTPKLAILAGDYLLSRAIEILLQIGNVDIIKNFQTCARIMCDSEIKQFLLRGKIPTIEEYLKICEGKTGLLFGTILEAVAMKANLLTKEAMDFGKLFGVYFQLKNDMNIESALIDKKNKIYTINDISGIENASYLLDNYRNQLLEFKFPNDLYKQEIEGLFA
jgi:geranylgeranyl pyrophosphate synthase